MRHLKRASNVRSYEASLDSWPRVPAVLLSLVLSATVVFAILTPGGPARRAAAPDEQATVSRGPGRFLLDLAIASEGETLLCRIGCAELLEWSLADQRLLRRTDLAAGTRSDVLTASISADGSTVARGCLDGAVTIFRHGRPCASMPNEAPVAALVCSPDGRHVAWAAGHSIALWNAQCRQVVVRQQDDTWDGERIVFSGDGRRMFVAHAGEVVQVWDVATGAVVRAFRIPNLSVVAPAPDGRCLAVADPTGRLELWSAETGLRIAALVRQGDRFQIFAAGFSPDGRRLACGRSEGTVELWDVAGGTLIEEWIGHAGAVCELRFFGRSDRLWTAGLDGTIRLWNLETRVEARRIDVNEAVPVTNDEQT